MEEFHADKQAHQFSTPLPVWLEMKSVLSSEDKENIPVTTPCLDDGQEVNGTKKSVRRQLYSQMSPDPLINKIEHFKVYSKQACNTKEQVAIHYPSGTKYKVLESAGDEQIIKAVFRDEVNKFQTISDRLLELSPECVLRSVGHHVANQAKQLSKKYSILHDVTYKGIHGFTWDLLEQELKVTCPSILLILSAIAQDPHKGELSKHRLLHVLVAAALCLRARNREMSSVAYQVGFILKHGGCTLRDIERISNLGLSMSPASLDLKLKAWGKNLDGEVLKLRQTWEESQSNKVEPIQTYQLAGDNWDRNILPTYRTAKDKTLSLHLFQVVAFKDRILFGPSSKQHLSHTDALPRLLRNDVFIPAIADQEKLKIELTFLVASAVINNIPCLQKHFRSIYPDHLPHKYSEYAGQKTEQFPLGLFDCDERKTQEVVKLLKTLSADYVPRMDEEVLEQVFFGGDRLTDEQVQVAQQALANGRSPRERLEGFISKMEDFHRLMNFLEAIHKLTYSTKSACEAGSIYYFRNLLNKRNVKGGVKNSYRAYKTLYYIIFEAMCCSLLLKVLEVEDWDGNNILPPDFTTFSQNQKIAWIDEKALLVVNQYIFDGGNDMFTSFREVLNDPDHEENYWMVGHEDRFHCHFCEKIYSNLGSVKAHEKHVHKHDPKRMVKMPEKPSDELFSHLLLVFKLVSLHKNLDSAVNMGDGERVVRSAKYETPIYSRTGKVKYLIGSIQITSLIQEHLTAVQVDRFVWNRFVNICGGKNSNLSIDEYIEILNRETKVACRGYQTKESIIEHSKQFPLLTDAADHFDAITSIKGCKGFHKIPDFQEDVKKVWEELRDHNCLIEIKNRKLPCSNLCTDLDVFLPGVKGLPVMIARHHASMPVRRLRDKRF